MKKKPVELSEETRIVHGTESCFTTSGDLVPPIHMTSTFQFQTVDHSADIFQGKRDGFVYSRISNPSVELLQEKIADLEGGEAALALSSGMAAVASIPLSLSKPGDNFVSSDSIYGGTFSLFKRQLKNYNLTCRFLSSSGAGNQRELEKAVDQRTRFLFIETPTNPTLDVIDIGLWAETAEKKGIPLVVDNTFASPYLQKPLRLGADIVVHSATKYLNGHGDVVGGLVVGTESMMNLIKERYLSCFGPVMSPFNAWLISRGIKTLALRMEKHSDNAMEIASYLENHPKIRKVFYPGLKSHPFHAVAEKQMKKFGGMLAFEVAGGIREGRQVLNGVTVCILAVSLGDCETLIQHPPSMTHAAYTKKEREKAGIGEGLIRLSVGLENAEDIMADLEQALSTVKPIKTK